MNQTLWWIATHLDNYHFNTDRARRLKRNIQVWTTLSEPEQETQERLLLRQFSQLFANNPWLEQNKLVTDERVDAQTLSSGVSLPVRCGEITGASTDAYFIKGKHWMLKPPARDVNGADSGFLSEEVQEAFLQAMKADALAYQSHFTEQVDEILQNKKNSYGFILFKNYKLDGESRRSPGLFSAVVCLLYLLAGCRLWLMTWKMFTMKQQVKVNIPLPFFSLFPAKPILVISSLVFLIVLFLYGKVLFNNIVKGFYRTAYLLYIKRMEQKVNALKSRVHALESAVFFQRLKKSMEESRKVFCQETIPVGEQDKTRGLLKTTYTRTLVGDLGAIKPPWEKYSRNGEVQISHLKTVLLVSLLVLYALSRMNI